MANINFSDNTASQTFSVEYPQFTGEVSSYLFNGSGLQVDEITADGKTIVTESSANGEVVAQIAGENPQQSFEWARIVFRYSDPDNYWQLLWRHNGLSEVKLFRAVNGVTEVTDTFDTGEPASAAITRTIRIEYDGDNIEVYYSNNLIGTRVDSFNNDATQVGLAIGNINYEVVQFNYTEASVAGEEPDEPDETVTKSVSFAIPDDYLGVQNSNYMIRKIGDNPSILNGVLDTSSASFTLDLTDESSISAGDVLELYSSDITATNESTASVMWDRAQVVEL